MGLEGTYRASNCYQSDSIAVNINDSHHLNQTKKKKNLAVCALMLGRRMGFLMPNPPTHVKQLAAAVKQLFISQRDSYYGLGLWKYIPTKTYRDFVKSEETIYK